MVTKSSVRDIINNVHTSIIHKSEKKTHLKLAETHGNILRSVVTAFIQGVHRAAVF